MINQKMPEVPNWSGKIVKYGIGLMVGITVLGWINPFVVVPAGSRGVITTFGKVNPEVLGEGLHFRLPIAQKVNMMDVRIQKGEGRGDAASKDLQTVKTNVTLNYHIKPELAAQVFQDTGYLVGDRIVVPAVQESVKAIMAQYTAEELISKRDEVKSKITANLNERLGKFGLVVDEFSITNFDFSDTFNNAIESKTTAEQLKLKAERDLERIKIEATQKIESAKAEAESLRIQRQEVTKEMLELRKIENEKLAIEKWDGKLPSMTGGTIPFVNVK